VESGAVEQLFTTPRHPYTHALITATPGEIRPLAERQRAARQRAELATRSAGSGMLLGCRYAPRCPNRHPDCDAEPPPLETREKAQLRCLYPLSGPAERVQSVEERKLP